MKRLSIILGLFIVLGFVSSGLESEAVEDIINIRSHLDNVRSKLQTGHQKAHADFHNARKKRVRDFKENNLNRSRKKSTTSEKEKPEPTPKPTVREEPERESSQPRYRYPRRYGLRSSHSRDRTVHQFGGTVSGSQPRAYAPMPQPQPQPAPQPQTQKVEVIHVYRRPANYPALFQQVKGYEPSEEREEVMEERGEIRQEEEKAQEEEEILSPNEILLQKGIMAFYKYQFSRAEAIFEQLKESDSGNPHVWILDGLVQLAQKDYEEARTALEEGFSIFREKEQAIPSVVDYYEEERHFQFQKDRLKRFIEKNPDHGDATNLYLLIQQSTQNNGNA